MTICILHPMVWVMHCIVFGKEVKLEMLNEDSPAWTFSQNHRVITSVQPMISKKIPKEKFAKENR